MLTLRNRHNISPPNKATASRDNKDNKLLWTSMSRSPTMRIKGRKSRVDSRQPQRGGRFTSAQLAWMDRDQERLHRAREREKKRIANKKKQAEREAREREERREQGIPDPHAMPVPSSQPLLSKFLAKPKSAPLQSPSVETMEFGNDDGGIQSDGGDTEPCTPSSSFGAKIEAFDIMVLKDAEARVFEDYSVAAESTTDDPDRNDNVVLTRDNGRGKHDEEAPNGLKDDDEDAFSECSAFYDEDFIREAETVATAQAQPQKTSQSLEAQSKQRPPAEPAVVEGYRKAETVAIAQRQSQRKAAQPQPQPIQQPTKPAIEESFRDDTADFLEQFGCDLGADEYFDRELAQINAG